MSDVVSTTPDEVPELEPVQELEMLKLELEGQSFDEVAKWLPPWTIEYLRLYVRQVDLLVELELSRVASG